MPFHPPRTAQTVLRLNAVALHKFDLDLILQDARKTTHATPSATAKAPLNPPPS